MRCRHHALAVYLNDAVTDADASSLSDASSHQAADLRKHTHSQKLKTQVKVTASSKDGGKYLIYQGQ